MSEKRQDYISWDEYFMGVAKLAGLRSKDPNSQVGSCIVSPVIRSCPLVIMVFRGGVRTMYSPGAEKAMSWIPSIFMLLTAN